MNKTFIVKKIKSIYSLLLVSDLVLSLGDFTIGKAEVVCPPENHCSVG